MERVLESLRGHALECVGTFHKAESVTVASQACAAGRDAERAPAVWPRSESPQRAASESG